MDTATAIASNKTKYGANFVAPTAEAPYGSYSATPITASTLTTPVTPLKVAPVTTPTLSTGLVSDVTSGAELLVQAQAEKAKAQGTSDVTTQRLADLLSERQGQSSLESTAYSTDLGQGQSVDQTKQELNDINAQINAKSLSYRRQIEEIQRNAGGVFGGAMQQNINDIQRKASSELADLSVIQMAKQNNYTGAKEIADRKVAAQMEQQNINLENAQFFYKENKDQLTKAEDREFQMLLADRERAIAKETAELDAVNDIGMLAAQNGADTATVQKILASKTQKEALEVAGNLVQSPMLKFQLENARLENLKLQKEISLIGEPTVTEKAKLEAAKKSTVAATEVLQDKITLIDSALNSKGITSRVGTNFLSRTPTGDGFFGTAKAGLQTIAKIPLTLGVGTYADAASSVKGEGQQFSGAIHKLASQEFLNALISAKAQGATFGALTDREGDALRAAATQLNDWEIKDKKGLGTGVWNIDEASFKKELNTIKTLAQKAISKSQGNLLSEDENTILNSVYEEQQSTLAPASYY